MSAHLTSTTYRTIGGEGEREGGVDVGKGGEEGRRGEDGERRKEGREQQEDSEREKRTGRRGERERGEGYN